MKNTGIFRRVDDLGRIVLPKELRRTLGISEGDPLEIHVNGTMICLCKYCPTATLEGLSVQMKSVVDELPATSPYARKIVDKIAELDAIIANGDK